MQLEADADNGLRLPAGKRSLTEPMGGAMPSKMCRDGRELVFALRRGDCIVVILEVAQVGGLRGFVSTRRRSFRWSLWVRGRIVEGRASFAGASQRPPSITEIDHFDLKCRDARQNRAA